MIWAGDLPAPMMRHAPQPNLPKPKGVVVLLCMHGIHTGSSVSGSAVHWCADETVWHERREVERQTYEARESGSTVYVLVNNYKPSLSPMDLWKGIEGQKEQEDSMVINW